LVPRVSVLTPEIKLCSRPYGFWVRQIMHEEAKEDFRAGKKKK
jgi:hypothetical protein